MSRAALAGVIRRIPPLIASGCGVILALCGCATAPTPPLGPEKPLFSVPYRIDAGARPVIDVSINGQGPYEFILDTGSTTSALFTRALKNLGGEPSWAETAQVFGISGANARPMTTVRSVTLAGDVETGLESLVVLEEWEGPPAAPDGIIGLDALSKYFILVDAPAQTILFFPSDEPPVRRLIEWARAPMQAETFGKSVNAVYLLEGRIKGRTFPALIDSGLEITVGNEPLLRSLPTIPPAPQTRTNTRITGATEGIARSFLLLFGAMAAGDIVWTDGKLYIADADLFADLGYADRPFALLGFDLLGS
ncbi:MAG: retropepsin-like aspartic protease, partial [Amphiplicatus sp.]